jgi:alpha-D-ribose 1-methylphosphonate 5-triphosphate synthase subunit PhnG
MTQDTASVRSGSLPDPAVQRRRRWLGVLARAPREWLEDGMVRHGAGLAYTFLRAPERGMVMLCGRIGGGGDPFNLGEATVTRCTVRLPDGSIGSGHVLGRDTRKAELVAVLDALLQDPTRREAIVESVVEPAAARQQELRDAASRTAAATRVAFYTMVRGE